MSIMFPVTRYSCQLTDAVFRGIVLGRWAKLLLRLSTLQEFFFGSAPGPKKHLASIDHLQQTHCSRCLDISAFAFVHQAARSWSLRQYKVWFSVWLFQTNGETAGAADELKANRKLREVTRGPAVFTFIQLEDCYCQSAKQVVKLGFKGSCGTVHVDCHRGPNTEWKFDKYASCHGEKLVDSGRCVVAETLDSQLLDFPSGCAVRRLFRTPVQRAAR